MHLPNKILKGYIFNINHKIFFQSEYKITMELMKSSKPQMIQIQNIRRYKFYTKKNEKKIFKSLTQTK